MPGKEADFPSRKQRKAAGKNGIMGRAAGDGGNVLPLYEHERSSDNESGNVNGVGGQNLDPKGDVSYGYARDL